jgi:hypothetical protein
LEKEKQKLPSIFLSLSRKRAVENTLTSILQQGGKKPRKRTCFHFNVWKIGPAVGGKNGCLIL